MKLKLKLKYRKLSLSFPLLISMAVLCASCKKERLFSIESTDSVLIPLSITGSIEQQHTKATDAGFVSGDALGLFAVNYSEGNTVPGSLFVSGNQADNVKYVFDGNRWTPVRKAYYKDARTNVDLYVYYPYQSSLSDIEGFNFEVAKDQSKASSDGSLSPYEASDFLWGKGENVVPTESNVSVHLTHRMSSVHLILVEGTGFGGGEFDCVSRSAILTGTTRKAQIDFSNGTVTKLGEPQHDGILMCFQEDASFKAIVVPQSINAGSRMFSITLDGISYGFSSDSDVEYKSGKQVNVTVKINKKTPSGEYELTPGGVSVSDWVEASTTHGGEARQYYVVNVEKRGTLGETLRAAGKDASKIRHLKITGEINTDDYYFIRDTMMALKSLNLKEVVSYGGLNIQSKWIGSPSSYYRWEYEEMVARLGEPDAIINDYAYWYGEEEGAIPQNAFNGRANKVTDLILPEHLKVIGEGAFYGVEFWGQVILPDDLIEIQAEAFKYQDGISNVVFNDKLSVIGDEAFRKCSGLSGTLMLPDRLEYIGNKAFEECNLSGRLILPESLSFLGENAFSYSGSFSGGLIIPPNLTEIKYGTFSFCSFSGALDLNNVVSVGADAFTECGFSGDLVIPSPTTEVDGFSGNKFKKIVLPSSVEVINDNAFSYNDCLLEIDFGSGLRQIRERAFNNCWFLNALILPATVQQIQDEAFYGCENLSKVVCNAVNPPTLIGDPFNSVPKNNFMIEVPENSVSLYKKAKGWSDFNRIGAGYDFYLERNRFRTLNKPSTKTVLLNCPAEMTWSVESQQDWVTVSPDHGMGNTIVNVSIQGMEKTPVNSDCRTCSISFSLDGKNFSTSMEIEQYNYEYDDGDAIIHQQASQGSGIDIIFIGDGYDAKDISSGVFLSNVQEGISHFFDIEPYTTYKDRFNVYSVITLSEDSGIGTVAEAKINRFQGNGVSYTDEALGWALNVEKELDITKTVVILLENTSQYYGWTRMYGDGSALAVVPVSREPYPYDFRGLIQHEAGGHAFGKLGDEYIYHNSFVSNCHCDCCDHPRGEGDSGSSYGILKSRGWYRNLSTNSDPSLVPWSHLLYNPKYSDYVDIFEGAYMHTRGVFRSEISSCMNNNIPYFSSISRQTIVERIMEYSGEEFTMEKFYANDKNTIGGSTKSFFNQTGGVDPNFNLGPEHGSVIYMGDHPNINREENGYRQKYQCL